MCRDRPAKKVTRGSNCLNSQDMLVKGPVIKETVFAPFDASSCSSRSNWLYSSRLAATKSLPKYCQVLSNKEMMALSDSELSPPLD